jgi:hypothetical protein
MRNNLHGFCVSRRELEQLSTGTTIALDVAEDPKSRKR